MNNAFLLKLALPTIMPPPLAGAAKTIIPKAAKVPVIGSGDFGKQLHIGKAITGAIQNAATVPPGKIIKAAADAFFSELLELRPDLVEKVAHADVEEMLKAALSVGGMGAALKGGMGQVAKGLGSAAGAAMKPVGALGGALQGGLKNVRGGIANVAGKISPTLNKPVMQVAQEGAHKLQKSPNSFVQGVGNVLHHKAQSPGKMFLAAANPVGTAAEAVTAGAGTAASKGMVHAGGALQKATAAGDAVVREGRAMTPKGRLMNTAESLGGRVQNTFSPGGTGHNVLTKKLPLAGEIGGAVGAGLALHAPVGLAGVAGKLGLLGAAKAAPAVGAAIDHAPGAIDALSHKVAPAVKGVGQAVQHGAEDVLGTLKQQLGAKAGRRAIGGAAQHVGHSIMPPAPKLASVADVATKAKGFGTKALQALHKYEDPIEVAGLGVLAAPGIDSMVAAARARRAGASPDDHHAVDKYRLLKERHHNAIDVGGLGVLAAPLLAKRKLTGSWTGAH